MTAGPYLHPDYLADLSGVHREIAESVGAPLPDHKRDLTLTEIYGPAMQRCFGCDTRLPLGELTQVDWPNDFGEWAESPICLICYDVSAGWRTRLLTKENPDDPDLP